MLLCIMNRNHSSILSVHILSSKRWISRVLWKTIDHFFIIVDIIFEILMWMKHNEFWMIIELFLVVLSHELNFNLDYLLEMQKLSRLQRACAGEDRRQQVLLQLNIHWPQAFICRNKTKENWDQRRDQSSMSWNSTCCMRLKCLQCQWHI